MCTIKDIFDSLNGLSGHRLLFYLGVLVITLAGVMEIIIWSIRKIFKKKS